MKQEAIRFAHVSIVARDWRVLARFYQDALGCTPVPPERDLSGNGLDRATGVADSHIRGGHLRLPGYGFAGPTLEIFQYTIQSDRFPTAVNRPGLAHTAFAVDDVHAALRAVLAAGGGRLGDVVTMDVPGAGQVTFVYAADPEGNLIELQRWSHEPSDDGL